jgi:glutaredoxin
MEIIAYTSKGCFYCDKLKDLFARANLEYTILVLGEDFTGLDLNKKYPNVIGFPYVIIDGEPIGGLVETAKFLVQKNLVSSPKK